MTKKEMLQEVDKKVQNWLWKEYIAGFDSAADAANSALHVAAVMAIANMIHDYVCDPVILDDEEEIDNLFWEEGKLQEFYDFFFKYDCTAYDIAENWIFSNEPSFNDVLGLYSYEAQLNAVLDNISYLIKDIEKRKKDKEVNRNE